jgi:hypothetical protein
MLLVEKEEVEGEAHAEGVHARAAGDEKTRANLVALELSEPKQARPEANRDRNPMAKHRVDRKPAQTKCDKSIHHEQQVPPATNSPPPNR